MITVCLSGTQSTGKTTLIKALEKEYPQAFFYYEIVRSLKKKVNKEASEYTQYQIYLRHALNFLDARTRNLAFFDRGFIDSVAYSKYESDNNIFPKEVTEEGERFLANFNCHYSLNLYLPPTLPIVRDGFREEDYNYRNIIHNNYLNLYKKHNISYVVIDGSVEKRVDIIKNLIKEII